MSNVTNAKNMFWAADGNSDYLYKNLTEVKLEGLKSSIDLSNLAALSLESVRYIFINAVHIANKTITLYTDVYNKVPKEWLDEMTEKGWKVVSSNGFSKFGETANALKEDINYLDNKLVTKVDKVEGKGLSTNDYTDNEKSKLSTLPTATELDATITGVSARVTTLETDGGKLAFIDQWKSLSKIYNGTLIGSYDAANDKFNLKWEYKDEHAKKYMPSVTYEEAVAMIQNIRGSVLGYDALSVIAPANLPPKGYQMGSGPYLSMQHSQVAMYNQYMEVLIFATQATGTFQVNQNPIQLVDLTSLKAVIGVPTGVSSWNPLSFVKGSKAGFPNLEFFRVQIKQSFDVRTSPLLTLDTMQYLVTYAQNTTPITVTVHPDVYAKLTGDTTNAAASALTADELAQWQALVTTANSKNISFATTSN